MLRFYAGWSIVPNVPKFLEIILSNLGVEKEIPQMKSSRSSELLQIANWARQVTSSALGDAPII